jgi:hypothetical protein
LKKSPNFEKKTKQILAQILLAVKNRLRKFENIRGQMLKCFLEFVNTLETEEFRWQQKIKMRSTLVCITVPIADIYSVSRTEYQPEKMHRQ